MVTIIVRPEHVKAVRAAVNASEWGCDVRAVRAGAVLEGHTHRTTGKSGLGFEAGVRLANDIRRGVEAVAGEMRIP